MGKGGFARCYELTDISSGIKFAGKIISKKNLIKPKAQQKLITEIKIHKKLEHRHVVQFHRYFEDAQYVYIVLERCTNQTLMELIKRRKRLSEPEARYYMNQILDGVNYMHKRKVIHRDLKLGNLFLSGNMHIKIGDLGLATELEHAEERKRTICGTPNYIAPEVLDSKLGHSFEVDVWSLGVILYTMIFGKPPFETSNVKATYRKIRANAYCFPEGVDISPMARDLIVRTLQGDPSKRPSVEQMMQHPFFTDYPIPETLDVHALREEPVLPQHYFLPLTERDRALRGASKRQSSSSTSSSSSSTTTASASSSVALSSSTGRAQKTSAKDLHQVFGEKLRLDGAAAASTAGDVPPRYPSTATTSSAVAATSTAVAPTVTSRPPATLESAYSTAIGGVMLHARAADVRSARARGQTPAAIAESESPDTAVEEDACNLTNMHKHLVESFAVGGSGSGSPLEQQENKHPQGSRSRRIPQERVRSGCSTGSPLQTSPFRSEENVRRGGAGPSAPSGSASLKSEKPEHGIVSGPSVWVTKYADFSDRYGMAYMMNDGSIGVHYNDSTKMVLQPDGSVEYLERKKSPGGAFDKHQLYSLTSFPESLQKKITLIKFFHKHLSQSTENVLPNASYTIKNTGAKGPEDLVYVKRWLSNSSAMIFRLSNKCVQVNFKDNTELILSSEARVVTYTGRSGLRQTLQLADIMQSPQPDIAKRLRFTKDVLYQLISSQRPPHPSGSSTSSVAASSAAATTVSSGTAMTCRHPTSTTLR